MSKKYVTCYEHSAQLHTASMANMCEFVIQRALTAQYVPSSSAYRANPTTTAFCYSNGISPPMMHQQENTREPGRLFHPHAMPLPAHLTMRPSPRHPPRVRHLAHPCNRNGIVLVVLLSRVFHRKSNQQSRLQKKLTYMIQYDIRIRIRLLSGDEYHP